MRAVLVMAALIVLTFAAAAALACKSNQPRPPDEGAYLRDVLVALEQESHDQGTAFSPGQSITQADFKAAARAIRDELPAWKKMQPPADVRAAHEALIQATAKEADAFTNVRSNDVPTPGPTIRAAALQSEHAYEDWELALRNHYGVTLFRVEGASMAPALCADDWLAFKPPSAPPARWDVIVFRFPLDESRDFIKRVVGLPGETVEISDGEVYIDGSPLTDDVYEKDPPNYTFGPLKIPADNYFVLGDNRRLSYDSHAWSTINGTPPTVPRANILGVLPPETKVCRYGDEPSTTPTP